MKKSLAFVALVLAFVATPRAQRVVTDNFNRLEVHYQTPALSVDSRSLADGKADLLQLAGYQPGGEVGSPVLPMRIDVITIPFCDDIVVEVSNAVYDTVNLSTDQKINFYPLQPSRFKSDTLRHDPVVDANRYATDAFYGMPLASVEVMGVARDRRLANLAFSPLKVNPVSGEVIVCRSADIIVHYINSDVEGTLEHYGRYHTPAFSAGETLNNLDLTKGLGYDGPIRMVIIAPGSLRCDKLAEFANWKRSQGLMVDLVYTDEQQLSDNTAIANYLKNLYTNATIEAPAPTYLLLVGDNEQINAFDSKINQSSWNDHISDLYFVTWTDGDVLPDCYQGRFSATDTSMLAAIIDKTLLYERYAFENDEYLSRAALVSGEDNGYHNENWDNAWRFCDPTMDYIAKTYVKPSNGFSTVSYYKNNVNYSPNGVIVTGYCSDASSATALRELYSTGVGWVNYSAHGDWDRWHKPAFTNRQVSSMSNNGKPSIMIGNCCLTNKFDKPSCFGETLLRKENNAGAVAYFGGTNSTLWSEDFYWSVGVRSSDSIHNEMTPTYNASNLGMYDRLFHTHGEASDLYAITAGSMLMAGNMAVNSSTSQYKLYYWEIYELMGDPSLIPWMGRTPEMQVSVTCNGNTTTVTAVPYAYVAVVDSVDYQLHAAAFADANGEISFINSHSVDISHSFFTVTAQGYRPYQRGYSEVVIGIDDILDAYVAVSPNPAADRCTVSIPGLQRVELLDLTGRMLYTATSLHTDSHTLDLSSVSAGLYLLRLSTNNGVTVKKLIVNK